MICDDCKFKRDYTGSLSELVSILEKDGRTVTGAHECIAYIDPFAKDQRTLYGKKMNRCKHYEKKEGIQ